MVTSLQSCQGWICHTKYLSKVSEQEEYKSRCDAVEKLLYDLNDREDVEQ